MINHMQKLFIIASFWSLLLELPHLFFLLEYRHVFALQPVLNFLSKALDASVQQKQVIESLLVQLSCVVHPWLFIKMVNNDDLALFVFVLIELGDEFVSLDVSSWEVQSFTDMILFIFFRFSEVDQQEVSFNAHGQLFCFDCDRSKV